MKIKIDVKKQILRFNAFSPQNKMVKMLLLTLNQKSKNASKAMCENRKRSKSPNIAVPSKIYPGFLGYILRIFWKFIYFCHFTKN